MREPTFLTTVALLLAIAGTLVLVLSLDAGYPLIAYAQGPDGHATYYVAPSCTGVPAPCYTSVQVAVDAADDPDDVVKVAAGTYTDVQGATLARLMPSSGTARPSPFRRRSQRPWPYKTGMRAIRPLWTLTPETTTLTLAAQQLTRV